jgi:hypothetical protein
MATIGSSEVHGHSVPIRCGLLGGARMQHHLRQSLTSIDVVLLAAPRLIITFAGQKFDDKRA